MSANMHAGEGPGALSSPRAQRKGSSEARTIPSYLARSKIPTTK